MLQKHIDCSLCGIFDGYFKFELISLVKNLFKKNCWKNVTNKTVFGDYDCKNDYIPKNYRSLIKFFLYLSDVVSAKLLSPKGKLWNVALLVGFLQL